MEPHSDEHPDPAALAADVGRPAEDAEEAERTAAEDLGMTEQEMKKVAGEPVDTGAGVVVPAQQTVGAEESSGGGEFPDPDSERGAVVQEGR